MVNSHIQDTSSIPFCQLQLSRADIFERRQSTLSKISSLPTLPSQSNNLHLLGILRQMNAVLREEDGKMRGPCLDISGVIPNVDGFPLTLANGEVIIMGSFLGGGSEGLVYKGTTERGGHAVAVRLCWPVHTDRTSNYPHNFDISQANLLYQYLTDYPTLFPRGTGFAKLVAHGSLSHEPELTLFTTYRVMEWIDGVPASAVVKKVVDSGPAEHAKLTEILHQTVLLGTHLVVAHSVKASDLILNNFMIGKTATYSAEGTLFLPDLGKCEISDMLDEGCIARELAKYWQIVINQISERWSGNFKHDELDSAVEKLRSGQLR